MSSSSSVPDGPPSAASNDETAAPNAGVADERRPDVVFVPGLGLDSRSWQLVRDGLNGPSAVVLLPSLGQPAPRGTDLPVERQADRLLARLPSGRSTILVGHSASCPVVVEAACRTGDVVGLVLVCPVTDPSAWTWPRMLGQWARTATHERPSEAPTLVPQYRQTGIRSMLRGMDAMRHFRTDLALSRLALPTEIVRGEKDRIASGEWSDVLRRASNGRLTTVEGAAHMVPLTHPGAVTAAVDRLRYPNASSHQEAADRGSGSCSAASTC
jgi:pimeloyl-ACP methyl ester carboxylesterase